MPMLFTTASGLDTQRYFIEGRVDSLGHLSFSALTCPSGMRPTLSPLLMTQLTPLLGTALDGMDCLHHFPWGNPCVQWLLDTGL